MDAFSTGALARLPLAEAVLRVMSYVTDADFLGELFRRHRGRSYEKTLSFATLVHLVADALLEHGGSANQSFTRAAEERRLPVTGRAAYDKLRRLPVGLSRGFLAEATARLMGLA